MGVPQRLVLVDVAMILIKLHISTVAGTRWHSSTRRLITKCLRNFLFNLHCFGGILKYLQIEWNSLITSGFNLHTTFYRRLSRTVLAKGLLYLIWWRLSAGRHEDYGWKTFIGLIALWSWHRWWKLVSKHQHVSVQIVEQVRYAMLGGDYWLN